MCVLEDTVVSHPRVTAAHIPTGLPFAHAPDNLERNAVLRFDHMLAWRKFRERVLGRKNQTAVALYRLRALRDIGDGSGSAVLYLTCFSAKLERIFDTPGIFAR